MSTKILRGTYATGYYLNAPITTLSVRSTGYVEGQGIHTGTGSVKNAYTILNDGRITAGFENSAIYLGFGGCVVNGSVTDTKVKVIGGDQGGIIIHGDAGSVMNFGTILPGENSDGVVLSAGGIVTNGSLTDIAASILPTGIDGAIGVVISGGRGTVTNYGTISGSIGLRAGGVVTNGAPKDLDAFAAGVYGAGSLINFGYLAGRFYGAHVQGVITNGSASDTVADIRGGDSGGVLLDGAVNSLLNFGTISSPFDGAGVSLSGAGKITNGTIDDTLALIEAGGQTGYNPAVKTSATALTTIENFGNIASVYQGVYLGAGLIVNGDAADTGAVISAYTLSARASDQGAALQTSRSSATIRNFGTIIGKSDPFSGVIAQGALILTNGSGGDRKALIEGYDGVDLLDGGTVTNFGTIAVNGGVGPKTAAVFFASAADILTAESGSVFVGRVAAGAGTIDAVSGVAHFTGGIATKGTITGAGAVSLEGGTTTFQAGTDLAVAKVDESGAATVVDVETKLAYAGAWSQASGSLTVASGDQVTFTGVGGRFSGVLEGAGSIVFAGGADTLDAATLSAHRMVINGASVTLAGAMDLTGVLVAGTPDLIVASSGASLGGGGVLDFSNVTSDSLRGAVATATLTNMDDRILGGGALGGGEMILDNAAAGLIDNASALALVIDTGAHAILNSGRIEAGGAGGVTIASAVENGGSLVAAGGDLSVQGAVSGSGAVLIIKGVADFSSTFSQDVTFGAGGGELDLAHSTAYAATLRGFVPKAGATILDLADIAFGAATKASYGGTAHAGVLTVTDGTHTAHFQLAGDTAAPSVTLSSDGHGGTRVTDAFVAAMAGFGASAGGAASAAVEPPRAVGVLAAPSGA